MPLISTDCLGCGAPIKLMDGQGTCTFCGKQIMLESEVQPALPVIPVPTPTYFQKIEEFSPYSPTVTTVLAMLFGIMGVHRFYTGSIGLGIIYLLTGGLFMIGWIVDIIQLLTGTFRDSFGRKLHPIPMVVRVIVSVWAGTFVIFVLMAVFIQ